ncbi:MAG: glycine zipper 2TM domain-containing protein [Janthinobacterium lividum]
MKSSVLAATTVLALSVLAGCASTGYPNADNGYGQPQPYPQPYSQPYNQPGNQPYGQPYSQPYPQQQSQGNYSSFGVVESIQQVNTGGSGVGAGAVIGGIVGGLLGNQVGGGGGRTAATAAGVVGGALVGNQVQQRNREQSVAYQIQVRLDNGSYQTITQDSVADLNVGSRVRVENGRAFRY